MNNTEVEQVIRDLELLVLSDSEEDPDTHVREFTSFRALKAIKYLHERVEQLERGDYVIVNNHLVKRPISFGEWLEISDESDFDYNIQPLMWYVDFSSKELVKSDVEPDREKFFNRGLVHRYREDAVKHAIALLSFFGEELN